MQYVNVASFAILVFDYCLTFGMEATLIWPARTSFLRTLFFLARYTPFFDVPMTLYYSLAPNIALHNCLSLNVVSTSMGAFGIAIGELILLVWAYALSGCLRMVLIVFGTIYLIEVLSTVVLIGLYLRSLRFGPPLLSAIPGCNETGSNSLLIGVSFTLALFNEIVLISYTLWLGYKKYRRLRNPFIVTMYRDGITYFLLLFLGYAANFTILFAGEGELQELLTTFVRVMHSVLCSRVLLNVREVERRRAEESIGRPVTTSLGITFADDVYADT
ncbi:hypothetical protein MSAN_00866100 [Mycena sanguinolenta]|uniref:DUF6533 domain-containing protein n=1 Tax=Mycena sanguinolenta TaxID=230812 RepID=A0A8H6YX17_9AGAR|nr:hypothetical protein MSAN_00866100 [Mycena sanguinolenta]